MIYLFLADGFEETEATFPLDLLRRAGADVKTVAVGKSGRTVTGAHGITVTADIAEADADPEAADGVILPGGMPGADNLFASEKVKSCVLSAARRGVPVGAICAAPYILGRLGLLEGRRAVCFPGFEGRLEGARVCDAPVVTDTGAGGVIVTARSAGAAAEFGLALVSVFVSPAAADKVAAAIIYKK